MWYVDPVLGNDGNDGLSPGMPKKTYAALYPLLQPGDTVIRASNAVFTGGFVAPCDNLFLKGSRIVHNGLISIKAGPWIEVSRADGVTPSSGTKLWLTVVPNLWGAATDRIFFVRARKASTLPHEAGFEVGFKYWREPDWTTVDADAKWATLRNSDGTVKFWTQAASSPASDSSTYEINSAGYGVDARGKKITLIGGQHCKGFDQPFAFGGGSRLEDCTFQFISTRGFEQTNGGTADFLRCGGYDLGRMRAADSGNDEHGFRASGAGSTVKWTMTDCFADNIKEDIIQPSQLCTSFECDIYGTVDGANPVSQSYNRYTQRAYCENPIDIKCPGYVHIHAKTGSETQGAYIETSDGGACVSLQMLAQKFKMSGGYLNAMYSGASAAGSAGISMEEIQAYSELDHVGVCAAEASSWLQRFTNGSSRLDFSIVAQIQVTQGGQAIHHQDGHLAMLHTTAYIFGADESRRALNLNNANRASGVQALTLVGGPDSDNRYTYRLNWGTARSQAGPRVALLFDGLTGDSAALNGQHEITASYKEGSNFFSEFLSVSLISSPSKSGLVLFTIPKLDQMDGCLFDGTDDVLKIAYPESLVASSYGANCSNDRVVTNQRPVLMNWLVRRYNPTRVKADPGVLGTDLKPDTGGKLGGAQWRSDTADIRVTTMTSCTISGEWAVLTKAAHGFPALRRVIISGAGIDQVNGWKTLIKVDANTAKFRVRRGTPDTASVPGTIKVNDPVLTAGAEGLGTCPAYGNGGYTTDFQGNNLAADATPNFGAVVT